MDLSAFEPLTRREREILKLLGQQLTDREIADHLFVAPTTVKWFNRQIFKKLGVENRQEAVQRAASLGILSSAEAPEPDFQRNLPAQLTPFVGRTREVSDIRRALAQPDMRLMTLLAPGGMGKTRLAVEIGSTLQGTYGHGVCFVPLAGLTSPEPLVATIIDALGLQFGADGRSAKQQLFDALRHKHLLFVLDNFEHLLEGAPLITELLTAAPQVKVLVTSRERLNLMGELVYTLTGLEVDGLPAKHEGTHEAGALFIVCAQRVNPHFTADDVGSITRVCQLVQGMPLAIELAAAWSGTLTAAEIAAEIKQSADFLQTTMRNVPERLRSVRVVFEAAWARLNEDARQVFRRFSVFRGGCTREAAQAVTGASIASLAVLVDCALLWRNPRNQRYEVHELLRQYAEQQLDVAGETEAIRRVHHRYYADLAALWGAAMLADKQLEGLSIINVDEENIREALTYATLQASAEMIEPFTDLWNYYDLRSRFEDADTLFQAACDALEPNDSLALAKLLAGRAVFYERLLLWEAEYAVAIRGYEMILRLGVPARRDLPFAIITYADGLRDIGRLEEAMALYQEGLLIAKEVDFPLMVFTLSYHLASNAYLVSRSKEDKARVVEVYQSAVKLKNAWGTCFILWFLASAAVEADELTEAERLCNEILAIARPIRFNYLVDLALAVLSRIARQRGDWQAVYRINQETLQTRADTAPRDQIFLVLSNLAEAALILKNPEKARHHLAEWLALLREWTMAEQVIFRMLPDDYGRVLVIIAELLAHSEHMEAAVRLLSQAKRFLEPYPSKDRALQPMIDRLPALLEAGRATLGQEAFAQAFERGQWLTFADTLDVIALSL